MKIIQTCQSKNFMDTKLEFFKLFIVEQRCRHCIQPIIKMEYPMKKLIAFLYVQDCHHLEQMVSETTIMRMGLESV